MSASRGIRETRVRGYLPNRQALVTADANDPNVSSPHIVVRREWTSSSRSTGSVDAQSNAADATGSRHAGAAGSG
jgi:hypothetical protein